MNWKAILSAMLPVLLFSCSDMGEGPAQPINFHNRILFTSSLSGKAQLFMMNPDGTDIRQLTFGPYQYSAGRWSPDAQRIVCNSDQGGSTAGVPIFVMDVDGTNRYPIATGYNMTWSRDGKRIAYAFCPSCEGIGLYSSHIYVVNADGTGIVQLTNDATVWDDTPEWSLDGSQIYFTSNRATPQSFVSSQIYVMNANGTNIHAFASTLTDSSGSPALSPNGDMMAFHSSRSPAGRGGVFVINQTTFSSRLVVESTPTETFSAPRWSADGNTLVLGSYTTDGSAKSSIYTVNLNGFGLSRILKDSTANWPDWSH
jgi:TolB protein